MLGQDRQIFLPSKEEEEPLLTLGMHARSEGYFSCPVCVYVCVSALIFRLTHWNHKSEIPTDSSQYRNDF